MNSEQISLGGVPIIGFGDADPYQDTLAQERAAAPATIAGFFVGAIGGAALGNAIHKGAIGATVGTLVGGIGGALGGNLLASYVLRKTPSTQKKCDSLSAEESKIAFDKAKSNLEAKGTSFDATMWSDPVKFSAFMTEVYRVAGCQP